MRNAQAQLATTFQTARFSVIEGGRAATPERLMDAPMPAVELRYRGLALVNGAESSVNRMEKVDSFDQARRIVAQVEWEIEQQAARERHQNARRFLPKAATPMPLRATANFGRMNRFRRFFGL